jgi:4-aminobutyrate aminotransferase
MSPENREAKRKLSSEEIRENHSEYMFPCTANYFKEPLVVEKGEGAYVTDQEGETYLDFFAGVLTVSLGHCNSKVNTKIKEQVDKLQHISTLYPTENIVLLAKKLAEISPGELKKTYFTNSGTEADETAVFLAKHFTGRQEIVALRHGYSGRSLLAMSLTGHAPWRHGGTHIPGITHAASPYCYRCPFGLEYPSCELKCAADVEDIIRTTTSGKIAAFISEPIQGVGGFITPPKEYFEIVVPIIKKYGGVFICDEVQTGFARTGRYMFGIEHYNVEPDIMTVAKGIANGIPLAGTVARADIADSFTGLTISTFGGNPVSTAAALATIEVMEEENIAENVHEVGSYLKEGLEDMQKQFPAMGDVRGKGLMIGVEFVKEGKEPDPSSVVQLFEEMKKERVLIGKGGLYGNVVRVSPPLNISRSEADDFLKAWKNSLGRLV